MAANKSLIGDVLGKVPIVGDIFGGGEGGGGLGSILSSPYTILGVLQYISGLQGNKENRLLTEENQVFQSAEAEKARAFERELFQIKAALEKQAALSQAYGQQQGNVLASGSQKIGTLSDMVAAIQRSLLA